MPRKSCARPDVMFAMASRSGSTSTSYWLVELATVTSDLWPRRCGRPLCAPCKPFKPYQNEPCHDRPLYHPPRETDRSRNHRDQHKPETTVGTICVSTRKLAEEALHYAA